MKWLIPIIMLLTACLTSDKSELKVITGKQGELAKVTMKNGRPHGQAIIMDPNAYVVRTGHYENGVKTGPWIEKQGDTLYRELNYSKGLFHGDIITYWPKGNKRHQKQMHYGVGTGWETHYFEDGSLKERSELKQGVPEGAFERWVKMMDTGEVEYIKGQYCAGKKCGTWTRIYSDHVLRWRVDHKDGKRHGEMEWYNKSGDLQEIWIYDMDQVIEKKTVE